MRLALRSRVFSVVWGVWFAVALMEPAALHVCPMHDAMHGMEPAAAESHGAATHHHHAADDRPSPSHHQVCACIGACCAAVVTVLPSSSALVVAETIRRPAGVIHSGLTAFRPSEPEHARPPSQAPPLSLA